VHIKFYQMVKKDKFMIKLVIQDKVTQPVLINHMKMLILTIYSKTLVDLISNQVEDFKIYSVRFLEVDLIKEIVVKDNNHSLV